MRNTERDNGMREREWNARPCESNKEILAVQQTNYDVHIAR
jgi:hypothetical protein